MNTTARLNRLLSLTLCTVLIGWTVGQGAEDVETPEAIRERMAAEVERRLVEEGRRRADAQRLVNQARTKIELGQYGAARRLLQNALELDPTNEGAREAKREVDAYLPESPEHEAELVRSEETRARIREAAQLVEINSLLNKAQNKAKGATEVADTPAATSKELEVTLRELRSAGEDLRRARLKLKGLPARVPVDEPVQRVNDLSKVVLDLTRTVRAQRDAVSIAEAKRQANEERQLALDYEAKQHDLLLSQAQEYMQRWQWQEAQAALEEILKADPRHERASELLTKLKKESLLRRSERIKDREVNERKNLLLEIEEAAVPRHGHIIYPDDWEELVRRRQQEEALTAEGQAADWELDIRRKLEQPVSFEFQDTPLDEVVKFLSGYTGINMILAGSGGEVDDGGFGGGADRTVTLRLENVRLDNALSWIMTITNLDYKIEDEALYIDEPGRIDSSYITKVYDVSDLLTRIEHAPAPSADAGDDDDDDDDEDDISLEDILTQFVDPNSWGEERGAIDPVGRSLVIRQTAENHATIRQTFQQLRSAQSIQVSVTARFLNVLDAKWEEFSSSLSSFSNTVTAGHMADGTQKFRGRPPTSRDDYSGLLYDPDRMGAHHFDARGVLTHSAFDSLPTVLGSLGTPSVTSGLNYHIHQWGWLGQIQSSWLLRAVRENRVADKLWAPHLITYNNRWGWVSVEDERPYIAGYTVGDGAWQVQRDFAPTGSLLRVRPTVSSDKRYISLQIEASTEELIDMRPTAMFYTLTSEDADGDPIVVPVSMPIDLPQSLVQHTRTNATLPDGGSILLSGLSVNANGRSQRGVPILTDIPLLGRAFSGRSYQKEKRSLMILVNARMILLDEEEAKLLR